MTEASAGLEEFRRTVRRWLTTEAPAKSGPDVLAEEQARVGVTTKPFSVGVEMVGPTLISLGSEEQKRRYLAPIRSGEEIWCQLFSEPDAGSERASLGGVTSSGSPDELIALVHTVGSASDARVRNELATLFSSASLLQWSMSRAQGGESRLGALLKLQYSQHARRMTTAALDLLGTGGVARAAGLEDTSTSVWQDRFLFAPGLRIAGGTDEIQRNTIAERILRLPREPHPRAPG